MRSLILDANVLVLLIVRVSAGWVVGIARPVHIARTTHEWQIELRDEPGRLTCVSRITMAILAPAELAEPATRGG